MPPRSTLLSLPEAVRDDLNARLVGSGFQGYEALAEWLTAQGYAISKSALHRYGQDLQAEFDEAMADVRRTTELAKAMVAAGSDDGGDLMAAAEKIAQDGLIRLQIALRKVEADPLEMAKALPQITRAIADLNRSGISRAKWQQEVLEAAAEKAAHSASAAGVSAETILQIRRDVLGMAV